MMGRLPTQMKKLASLVLSEGYAILDKPKLIGERLKKEYDASWILKQRFLAKSGHSFLCPEDLEKMVLIEEGELACQKCGYTYNFPIISQPNVYNVDIQLFPLGSYRERFGELKGFNRFHNECGKELRSILEGYSLPERVLDFAGQILKQKCEIFFEKRCNAITRWRVILLTLIDLSKYAPELNFAAYIYLTNPLTPLHLNKQIAPTKSTKSSFSPIEEVSKIGY